MVQMKWKESYLSPSLSEGLLVEASLVGWEDKEAELLFGGFS